MFPETKAQVGAGIFRVQESDWKDITDSKNAKAFFKNSAIRRWRSDSQPSSYLLYLSAERKPTSKELQYLETFKEILKSRGGVVAGEYEWWGIHRSRRMEIFEGPKIVCPQRSGLNTFAYNEIAWYGSADVYYITSKNDQINLKAVLSLLNSKLYYCWFYNRGKRKGEALELFQVPLSELPMPRFPNKFSNELAKFAEFAMKFTAEGDPVNLSSTEERIDDLVFNCFGLTEKEKSVVMDFWNSKKSKVQDLEFNDLTD
jgi:adenine-specific DNA-methyltransferase